MKYQCQSSKGKNSELYFYVDCHIYPNNIYMPVSNYISSCVIDFFLGEPGNPPIGS